MVGGEPTPLPEGLLPGDEVQHAGRTPAELLLRDAGQQVPADPALELDGVLDVRPHLRQRAKPGHHPVEAGDGRVELGAEVLLGDGGLARSGPAADDDQPGPRQIDRHRADSHPGGSRGSRHSGRRRPVGPGRVPPVPACVELAAQLVAERTDPPDEVGAEAALGDPVLEHLVVLHHVGAVRRDDDVELEVLGVVADLGAHEVGLQVEVPAGELPLRPRPEVPDRVGVARPLDHQAPVALPARLRVPRVPAVGGGPVAGGEPDLGPGRHVGHQLLVGVVDDVHRDGLPRPTVPDGTRLGLGVRAEPQHLAPDDEIPCRPAVRHVATLPDRHAPPFRTCLQSAGPSTRVVFRPARFARSMAMFAAAVTSSARSA